MYTLEVGQLQSVPMAYSYVRRAQATNHRMIWKQVAICDEMEPLKIRARSMARCGLEFRIAGVGEHCDMEPIPLKAQ